MENATGNSHYIMKHRHYLDTRVKILTRELHLHDNHSNAATCHAISRIMHYLAGGQAIQFENNEVMDALEELSRLYDRWDIIHDGDMLGYVYQQLKSTGHKKKQGQFFTPPDIVEYIVEHALPAGETDITLLDPACGSGQFLVAAFNRLVSSFVQRGWGPVDAASHICAECIYGIDIDPVAVAIARCNLAKAACFFTGSTPRSLNIVTGDFLYMNQPPFPSGLLPRNRFTTIVGNPPWGARFTAKEKNHFRKHYQSTASGINSFTLFMEKSIIHLEDNGMLGFLVPEAYLNIKAHRNSRLLALDNTGIKRIALWGERFKKVFAPSVSIHMEKEQDGERRHRNIVQVHTRKSHRWGTAVLIPQEAYRSTHQNIFTIQHSRHAATLLSGMEESDCYYLKDRVRFFLGIVTGSNPRHVKREFSISHPDPIIIGKDIQPFSINYSGHHFRYDPEILQQVAPRDLYVTPNKVLYKFIGKRLTFAVDTRGYFSLNNVNGFVPLDPGLDPDILVSLLNSRVMQYYYQHHFFTVKVLRGNLERLPLRHLSADASKMLKNFAAEMRESGKTSGTTRENLEDIIFSQYGISDRDAHRITENIPDHLPA